MCCWIRWIPSGGERLVSKAEVVYLEQAGHYIPDQTARVLEFLRAARSQPPAVCNRASITSTSGRS